MSTLTDVVGTLKSWSTLKTIIAERVYTDLPEDLTGRLPCVKVSLVGGPPFQNGVGKIVATMERWRFTFWANDAEDIIALTVPFQNALLYLWGGYEVTFLDARFEVDPVTKLFYRTQDVRFIGCV